jgi:topoisomerase-4 subunit A
MGREILHVAVVPKEGDRAFYTMIYQDKESGKAFAKKFQLGGVTRDKLYPLAPSEGSRIVFLDVAKTAETTTQKVTVTLSGRCAARVKEFVFDLSELTIGQRGAKGLTVTQWPIRQVRRA